MSAATKPQAVPTSGRSRRNRGAFSVGPVETDVPLPSRAASNRIPFDTLDVGHSIEVRGMAASGVRAAASRWAKENKGLLTSPAQFKVQEQPGGFVRVWRSK